MEYPKYKIVEYTLSYGHQIDMLVKYEDDRHWVSFRSLGYYVQRNQPVEFRSLGDTNWFDALTRNYHIKTKLELKDDKELQDYMDKLIVVKELEG